MTLFQALPGEVVLVFEDASLTSSEHWAALASSFLPAPALSRKAMPRAARRPACRPAAASWADSTARVPFLQPFVYTSQAPTALLDSWAPLSEGNSTAGELSEVIRG